ncbi:hypothetical protein SCHPADRAFT_525468 [Schizopora paradoxa]|uniref:Uncharacterized protein n=1 Tax=Schizopora paradoxa TaxID=27342 RepID=A0A0H2RFC3_9AGAM|nr:hypothetical protein SCHPADRAFT_525468 [Schizopora paradoxa]
MVSVSHQTKDALRSWDPPTLASNNEGDKFHGICAADPQESEISSLFKTTPSTFSGKPSIWSEWSSNYTMSDLPGPGRILGNLYSSAGAALERSVARGIAWLAQRREATKRAEAWVRASEREVLAERVVFVNVIDDHLDKEVKEDWRWDESEIVACWDDEKGEWEFRESQVRENASVEAEISNKNTTLGMNWNHTEKKDDAQSGRTAYKLLEDDVFLATAFRSWKTEADSCSKDAGKPYSKLNDTDEINTRVVEDADEKLTSLWRAMSRSNSSAENERICEALLEYAGSPTPEIQVKAFNIITRCVISYPPLLRVFKSCAISGSLDDDQQLIDSVLSTWTFAEVDYDAAWRYQHRLVLVCLQSPVLAEFFAHFRIAEYWNSEHALSEFEGLLLRCRHVSELDIAVQVIARYWNGAGLYSILDDGKYQGPSIALVKLSAGIRSHFEAAANLGSPVSFAPYDIYFDRLVEHFISGMWDALSLPRCRLYDEAEMNDVEDMHRRISLSSVCTNLHAIFCMARSVTGKTLSPDSFLRYQQHSWKDECLEQAYRIREGEWRMSSTILQKLMNLEDTHGEEVLKAFPPTRR